MQRWLNNRSSVYWGVAVVSGLLTLYRVATRDLINGDGILYVNVAKAFLNEGIGAAAAVYHWPLYGILIGLVHRFTGLSFENAATSLNTLLLVVLCVVFVRVYEEIGGREARIWVAAVLILALPVLNDYRDMVVRDYGFWAFMLVALYYFIQYSRATSLQSALKWQLGIAAAILFRVEGIAFLVFAPFCLLFVAEARSRIVIHLLRLNSLFILLAVAGAAVILASGVFSLSSGMEIPYQLSYASPMVLLSALNTEAEMMFSRNQFMSSVGDARLILASGLLTLVIVKVVSNIGLPLLAVLGYGTSRKWIRLTRESFIVLYFAAIGILPLAAIAGNFFFVSSRYTVLTVLLISLVAFQYVDYLLRELSRRQLKKWSVAAGVLILVLFLDGVISGGASKRTIRVAGEWVNAELAAPGKMACNEARLAFYSQDRCHWVTLDDADPAASIRALQDEGYHYLLLWIHRKHEQLRSAAEADAGLALEQEFPGRKGGSVRLYRVVAAQN